MKKVRNVLLFGFIVVLALWTRLYHLDSLPISPYWEETALGYDAYSLLKTGKDHHGNPWPILAVESFGDWKPSGYFYATIPSVALFDLSVFAVRLPAALAGMAIITGVGMLAFMLRGNRALAMLLTTLSPWAIQFSRAAWEVNLATALLLWGVIFSLWAIKKVKHPQVYLFASVLLFSFSIYTYHAARVIAPLLWGLVVLYQVAVAKSRKSVLLIQLPSALLFIALLLPLLLAVKNPQVSQRFQETSIFSDITIIEESNVRRDRANYSLVSTLLYNRYSLFGREILNNALDHLDPQFLFISGDINPRHSTRLFGLLFHFEILFLTIGFIHILFKGTAEQRFLIAWVAIALLPVSVTKATPHALRFLPAMPAILLIVHFGILQTIRWIEATFAHYKRIPVKNIAILCLVGLYTASFSVFWRNYSTTYRLKTASEWQYGYEELISVVTEYQNNNQSADIAISRKYGRPAMYYWFFSKTNPREVQQEQGTAQMDQGEFLTFQNIRFFTEIGELGGQTPALIAITPEDRDVVGDEYEIYHQIESPDGAVIWMLLEKTTNSL